MSARSDLERLAARRAELTREHEAVTHELREAMTAALDEGMPETVVAKLAGVSRQTLRVWVGKSTWR